MAELPWNNSHKRKNQLPHFGCIWFRGHFLFAAAATTSFIHFLTISGHTYFVIHKPKAQWSVESWKWIVIAVFLEFGHSLWKFQNDTKFGKDKQEKAQLQRSQLEWQVSLNYASKPYLLPKFTHVFDEPLLNQLQQGMAAPSWILHNNLRACSWTSGQPPARFSQLSSTSAGFHFPTVFRCRSRACFTQTPSDTSTWSHVHWQQVPIPITPDRSLPLFEILPAELTGPKVQTIRMGIG